MTNLVIICIIFFTSTVHTALGSSNSESRIMQEELQTYINDIQSLAIDFHQYDDSHIDSYGMLIIDKPHKFRCNYYAPFPILIIGNKNYVSVYDYEMKHLSRISAKENIFNFLLVDKVDFTKQFEVISATKNRNHYIFKIKYPELQKTSEITFNAVSKQIEMMRILEFDKIITLKFSNPRHIQNISPSLFIIQNPQTFGAPKHLQQKDLEKLFTY